MYYLLSESTKFLRGQWGKERGGFLLAVLQRLRVTRGQPDLLFLGVSDTRCNSPVLQAWV